MNVRDALLAVLATVSVTACHNTSDCDQGMMEQFTIDEPLTPEQLDRILAEHKLPDREAIPCGTACAVAYNEATGWEVVGMDSCSLSLSSDPNDESQVSCTGTSYERWCNEGRRPLGHVESGDDGCGSPLGRSLAAMAYLEAASVDAFEQLADALVGWDAPEQLVERCRAAADDERHHARWLAALASGDGARVQTPTRTHDVSTSCLAFAEHNASEGCVHETFAALMAGVRARRAPDLRLRRVFVRIAVDEARHAQLAWDLDAWFRTQLDADAVARVEAARSRALAQLPARVRALAQQLPAELGTLDEPDAERLAEDLRARLAA